MKFEIQSLQFRRKNKAGRKTLRMVWDIVSREDSPARLLIETWGGKPDGYAKCFATDLLLGNYLSKRIAKSALDATDEDLDLNMVGDEVYVVEGDWGSLHKAMEAENHENAKLRMQIAGVKEDWDEEACLNKTLCGIVDFGLLITSANDFTQALAARVRSTFKSRGSYKEQLLSIHEFMRATGGELDDVLAESEDTVYPPMDRERIAEVIQLADGLREKMTASRPVVSEPEPIHITEPEIFRGSEWGGWA